jgi:GT2 family glycosyltransferase
VAEIVVVDGGSRDRTRDMVAARGDVRLVVAPRGRGPQMNAGARATTAPVLLFLHADVSLPADFAAHVRAALADPGVVGGAFRTWHVADVADGVWWIRPFLHVADVRSRVTRFPYGDQAMFARREAFEAVGGFPQQGLFEDVELAARLRRAGAVVTVPASVRVSGRRFLRSPLRAVVAMRLFPLLYRLGVPADRLARLYGDPR